ncbi:iron-binding protein [Kappamyces sp. JEL0829]|nr:iron-binding protein [Kappamyces sp. JEL0829]
MSLFKNISKLTKLSSPLLRVRNYHEKVLDHYNAPRNVGSLDKKSEDVGTGLVGAPACGDVMKLQILVDDATGEIKDVKFKTFGCGSAIASSSLVTEKIKGLSVWDAMKITNVDIAKELSLPPVKLHCSMLAEDAIKSAVNDWQSKRTSRRAEAIATATQNSFEIMQDQEVLQSAGYKGGAAEMQGALDKVFAKYEIPMGLLNKLLELQTYSAMVFLVDDSGSMGSRTDSMDPVTRQPMTRWQETRFRLLEMMEILAHIPCPPINVRFLNRTMELRLVHGEAQSPEQFLHYAAQEINRVFQASPSGTTPYVQSELRGTPDGGPTAIRKIEQLVTTRANPHDNPITFLSCTDQDADVEWMKSLEEVASYCSEVDDYQDEKQEVLKDQGGGLPYTKGFYLISALVSAMNPTDLDSMDESVPFTKAMLDNLLGMVYPEPDFRSYFDQFCLAQQRRAVEDAADQVKKGIDWKPYYSQFLSAPTHADMEVVKVFKHNLLVASGKRPPGAVPEAVVWQAQANHHETLCDGESAIRK